MYPALLEYQGMLMSEPLAATLLSARCWRCSGPRTATRAGRAGCCPGAAARRASDGAARVPRRSPSSSPLVVFARGARADWRRGLAQAAVLLAGVALVVAPWTVRNAVALDRFVPISTGGGQVLFAGTYLPSDGDPEKVGTGVVAANPSSSLRRPPRRCGWSRSSPGSPPSATRTSKPTRRSRGWASEQLWDDLSEEPLEYAGFVATKVERIWSHGPRDVMREPVWAALHWALLVFGMLGLAVLAWQRRWEALVIGTVFLSITAISALLVASPRRVLVMLPLLAALAGAGASVSGLRARRRRLSQNRSPKTPASRMSSFSFLPAAPLTLSSPGRPPLVSLTSISARRFGAGRPDPSLRRRR